MRLFLEVVCGMDIAGVGMYVTGGLVLFVGLLTMGGSIYLICGD